MGHKSFWTKFFIPAEGLRQPVRIEEQARSLGKGAALTGVAHPRQKPQGGAGSLEEAAAPVGPYPDPGIMACVDHLEFACSGVEAGEDRGHVTPPGFLALPPVVLVHVGGQLV